MNRENNNELKRGEIMTKEKKGSKCKVDQGKGDENYIKWQVSAS